MNECTDTCLFHFNPNWSLFIPWPLQNVGQEKEHDQSNNNNNNNQTAEKNPKQWDAKPCGLHWREVMRTNVAELAASTNRDAAVADQIMRRWKLQG